MPAHLPSSERLLSPQELVPAADVGSAPRSPGVYAWWFKQGCLEVPDAPYQTHHGHQLLYVGISPRKPSAAGKYSKSNLRTRLSTHAIGDASRSTLRRTLGLLLAEELGLTLALYARRAHYGSGETLITHWLRANARVSWVVDTMPWEAEVELLGGTSLALNLDGRTDRFARSISDRRIAALAAARAAR
ncbi:hypothetical protein LG314_09155 [Agrococcus terreus]|uniref:GIY-YIG nuclease family protein n=1 Tax=Agrococcus terreus TaxID=574649 RepID=UPI00384DC3B4